MSMLTFKKFGYSLIDLVLSGFTLDNYLWNLPGSFVLMFMISYCVQSAYSCLTLQVASFLLYLSNVEAGGETMFPFEVNWGIYCDLHATL